MIQPILQVAGVTRKEHHVGFLRFESKTIIKLSTKRKEHVVKREISTFRKTFCTSITVGAVSQFEIAVA